MFLLDLSEQLLVGEALSEKHPAKRRLFQPVVLQARQVEVVRPLNVLQRNRGEVRLPRGGEAPELARLTVAVQVRHVHCRLV